MFGPEIKRKYKPRGPGKNNLDCDVFALRIHPATLNSIRNISLRCGGIKGKASINTIMNLLLSRSLETEEIVRWVEGRFPASQKRDFIQFIVRD